MTKNKTRTTEVRAWTVADYIAHAEHYGPECVFETAVADLPRNISVSCRRGWIPSTSLFGGGRVRAAGAGRTAQSV